MKRAQLICTQTATNVSQKPYVNCHNNRGKLCNNGDVISRCDFILFFFLSHRQTFSSTHEVDTTLICGVLYKLISSTGWDSCSKENGNENEKEHNWNPKEYHRVIKSVLHTSSYGSDDEKGKTFGVEKF